MNPLGLNEFLMPVNSPIARNQGAIPSYEFDAEYERNSIISSKVTYITADKIATGTLVAGLNVGEGSAGYVLIDGPNNRILVNDGTTNRVVIGSI